MIKGILLIGPTGSGKTPLGELIEKRGINGKRCFHFDFGAIFRSISEMPAFPGLLEEDMKVIRRSLKTGSLLKDSEFHIALKILSSFIVRKQITEEDCMILNGMPRHPAQALGIESMISVQYVVYLECTEDVVCKRITNNTGGDRSGRTDDDLEMVSGKLKIFSERTMPLLDLYRQKRVCVVNICVTETMSTEEMMDVLTAQIK